VINMTNPEQETAIRKNAEIIWEQIEALDELTIYPAIGQDEAVSHDAILYRVLLS
jgi:hypothetical protein